MRKSSSKHLVTGMLALVVGVVVVGLAYAGFNGTLNYTSNNQNIAEDDTLLRHTTKNMTLKLELDSNMPASALSNTELSVSGLGITLLYSQASGYNGANSTAIEPVYSTDASLLSYYINNNVVTTPSSIRENNICVDYLGNP